MATPTEDEHDALKRSVATLEAQVAILMNIALGKGDTSINTVRATLGLPAFASAGETAPLSGKATEP